MRETRRNVWRRRLRCRRARMRSQLSPRLFRICVASKRESDGHDAEERSAWASPLPTTDLLDKPYALVTADGRTRAAMAWGCPDPAADTLCIASSCCPSPPAPNQSSEKSNHLQVGSRAQAAERPPRSMSQCRRQTNSSSDGLWPRPFSLQRPVSY